MQKKVTFSGREHSAVLDKHIDVQLEKLERLLHDEPSPRFIELTVETHEVHQINRVAGLVKTPHFECFAKHEGPEIYTEINEVVDRLVDQLRNEKKKLVDRHRKGCGKECRAEFFEELEREWESKNNKG